jgi:hypothetical protein
MTFGQDSIQEQVHGAVATHAFHLQFSFAGGASFKCLLNVFV